MLCRTLTYADVAFMWKALDTQSIADITLCYAVLKGVLQWIFGWLGDRYGRRCLVSVCVCVYYYEALRHTTMRPQDLPL